MQGVRLAPTLAVLFAAGFLVGPPMDGFHTNVDLLQYDKLPITIGAPAHVAAVDIQFSSSHRCHGRPILMHNPPVCSLSVAIRGRHLEDVLGRSTSVGHILRRRGPAHSGAR